MLSFFRCPLQECFCSTSKFYRTSFRYCWKKCLKNTGYQYNMGFTYSPRSYSVRVSTSNINLRNEVLAQHVRKIRDDYHQCFNDPKATLTVETNRNKVEKVIELVKKFEEIEDNISSLKDMKNDCQEESELSKSIEQEMEINKKELIEIEDELVNVLLPVDAEEMCSDIIMEIMPGVGGQESSLFAKELFDLYCKYLKFTGWNFEVTEAEENGIGGMKNATLEIFGSNSFKYLRFEGGVHQVQRVPKTEKGGRIHTSTASVAVYPRPSEVDIHIKDDELEWEAKTARGPGGQHVNKIKSAVRLTHLPTGMVTECQVSRSHNENRKIALQKLYLKLFQIESNKHTSNIQSTRKAQIKNKCRSEKARTYNFPQNRITDHRFKRTINNIPRFFEGGEYFHDFLEDLVELYKIEKGKKFLESLRNEK